MDNPKLCSTIARIEPGAEASVDLYALFNDKLLDVSEGTKVSTKISLEYSAAGAAASQDQVETLRDLRQQREHVGRQPEGGGLRDLEGPDGAALRQERSVDDQGQGQQVRSTRTC